MENHMRLMQRAMILTLLLFSGLWASCQPAAPAPAAAPTFLLPPIPSPLESVSASPRLRGVNIDLGHAGETPLQEDFVTVWKSWHINALRINFSRDAQDGLANPPTSADLWRPYTQNRARLSELLGWLRAADIRAVVSLSRLWGDGLNGNALWSNQGQNDYLAHRIAFAQEMARWLGEFHPEVHYLEVWNEPHPYDDLYRTYFLPEVMRAIRAVHPTITIVCMPPGDWGSIWHLENWEGLEDTNTIYSIHIYEPWLYTHQGIYDNPRLETGWPGLYKNFSTDAQAVWCDREAVSKYLAYAVDFRQRTGKRVMVTEFGVLRWAVDNDQYLQDLIAAFEENRLDWFFHTIAGWNGWNPTFAASDPEGNQPFGNQDTPAFQVLLRSWAENLPR